MKKVYILMLCFVLVIVFIIYLTRGNQIKNAVTVETPQTSQSTQATKGNIKYCTPSDLRATLILGHAAGNVYGDLSIENISGLTCALNADNFIEPIFTDTNINIKQQGTQGPTNIHLPPGQIIYSRVHYPNGPQCGGETKTSNISFYYKISDSDKVLFKDQYGVSNQTILVCKTLTSNTDVDVWSISTQGPINQ